jgi:hypothetical protein
MKPWGDYVSFKEIQLHKKVLLTPQHYRTGRGSKVITDHMIKVAGRWRRVYCDINSKLDVCYIIMSGERRGVSVDLLPEGRPLV